MTEAVEAGSGLAWRLLATLEGGSLLLAMSALIAYTARVKLNIQRRNRTVNSILITNHKNALGRELKRRLEFQGCNVRSVTSGAASEAEADQVDCLVVVGAEARAGLNGISNLVSEDVYENLNLMENLSRRVKSGGYITWVCAGDATGAYGSATAAFDTVIRVTLQHVAKNSHCEPIWVGRCDSVEHAVDRTVAELFPCTIGHRPRFALRNAAHKVSVFLRRWLKMAT